MARKQAEVITATTLLDRINANMKGKVVTLGSHPSYRINRIPTGSYVLDRMLHGGWARGRHSVMFGDYCLAPDTLALCADYSWREVGDLKVGDRLTGFDESPPGGRGKLRTFQHSDVLSNERLTLPSIRMRTDKGTVTDASEDHLWLAVPLLQKTPRWVRTADLTVGDKILYFGSPWEDNCEPYASAYLSGLFDGEGWVDGSRPAFAQNPGPVLDKGVEMLHRLGFSVAVRGANGGAVKMDGVKTECAGVFVRGGPKELVRFASLVKPVRLMPKIERKLIGSEITSKGKHANIEGSYAVVTSLVHIGDKPVCAIGTSTKTLIADGLYSHNSVCKTLIGYRTLALAQQRGESTMLIDAEHVFVSEWFDLLGGNSKELIIYPNREDEVSKRDANQTGNVLRLSIERGEGITPADVVLVDSVASLLPTEEMEHDLEDGDPRVASLARFMPLLLRQLTTMNDKTAFIWTNQWRDKISRIPGQKSTPGGKALGFFASTMIEMVAEEKESVEVEHAAKGKIGKRKMTNGRWVKCTLAKEKTGARPFDVGSFFLDFNTRMPDLTRELVDLGLEDGVIEFRGSRYYVQTDEGEVSAHGLGNLVKKLESEPELRGWLEALVVERTYELSEGVTE